MKNTVNSTKTENTEIEMKIDFVKVQMNNKKVKFQLDTGSDVTLINEKKKLGRKLANQFYERRKKLHMALQEIN